MKPLHSCILLTCTALLLSACSSTPEVVPEDNRKYAQTASLAKPQLPPLPEGASQVNGIAAIVNDDIITYREVVREAQPAIRNAETRSFLDDQGRRELRRVVLNQMVEKLLTQQKVKELGIRIGEDEIRQTIDDVRRQNNNMSQEQLEDALKGQGLSYSQYEAQIREQLEQMRLVSMEVRSKVNVTDQDAEKYYLDHPEKYAEEETFRARHIFIRIEEHAAPDKLQATMSKALQVLHKARDGQDFEELARQYSDDPAAQQDGGDLGMFKKGEMLAELENALEPLKPGEVGELVATPSGLHIVKLDERSRGKLKPFETVKDDIRELLYRQMQDERFKNWMGELRAKASIIIKEDGRTI